MVIIRNSILPFGKRFAAINLFGILFVKYGVEIDNNLTNHEKIHTAQMRELLYIPFYIIYILEWLLLLVRFKGDFYTAYRKISFEQEAYQNAADLSYLNRRFIFAQWRANHKS